jgi:uncharacterized protein YdaU (DUF1376 family)
MTGNVWMPMYWGDYMRDTAHLTPFGHCAYLHLIAHYWVTGAPHPYDDEKLRRIARLDRGQWKKTREDVAAFFQVDGGLWRHTRIEVELVKSDDRKSKFSERGKSGGLARANNARSRTKGLNSNDTVQLEADDKLPTSPACGQLEGKQPQPQPQLQNLPPPTPAKPSSGEVAGAGVVATPPARQSVVIKPGASALASLAADTPQDSAPTMRSLIGRAFDDAQVEVYGDRTRRLGSPTNEIAAAEAIAKLGLSIALVSESFVAEMRAGQDKGRGPIQSLAYFRPVFDRMAAEQAAGKVPMIAGRPAESAEHVPPPERSAEEKWRDAMRSWHVSGVWADMWPPRFKCPPHIAEEAERLYGPAKGDQLEAEKKAQIESERRARNASTASPLPSTPAAPVGA